MGRAVAVSGISDILLERFCQGAVGGWHGRAALTGDGDVTEMADG